MKLPALLGNHSFEDLKSSKGRNIGKLKMEEGRNMVYHSLEDGRVKKKETKRWKIFFTNLVQTLYKPCTCK